MIGSWGWSPSEWDWCPYKRDLAWLLSSLCRVRLQWEEGSFSIMLHANFWLPHPITMSNKFLLYKSPGLWYCGRAALTEYNTPDKSKHNTANTDNFNFQNILKIKFCLFCIFIIQTKYIKHCLLHYNSGCFLIIVKHIL